MNVLILLERMRQNGAESSSASLADGLAELGHQATLAAAAGPLESHIKPSVRFWKFGGDQFWSLPFRIGSAIRAVRPDIIHAQGVTLSFAARVATKYLRTMIPIVLTHHTNDFQRMRSTKIRNSIVNWSCDGLIALTSEQKRQFVSQLSPRYKIETIPNSVDVGAIQNQVSLLQHGAFRQSIGIRSDEVVISNVSWMGPLKRIPALINSIDRAGEMSQTQPVGLIIGDGPERPHFERLANEKHHARFVWTGFREDVIPYLAVSDITASTSRTEVLPMFLIEASLTGNPVVAMDIPATKEIVDHGTTGFVANDDSDVASHLAELIRNPVQRKSMGQAGLNHTVELFGRDTVVPKVAEFYKSVLDTAIQN